MGIKFGDFFCHCPLGSAWAVPCSGWKADPVRIFEVFQKMHLTKIKFFLSPASSDGKVEATEQMTWH